MVKLETLGNILNICSELDENLNFVTNEDLSLWSPKTLGSVLTDEELENYFNDDSSALSLGIYQISDVLENLKLQKPDFCVEEFIEAIIFYIKNDAFIEK